MRLCYSFIIKLTKTSCWYGSLTLHEKIFQHEYQRLVKMCIYLYLFHKWFPLGFVFTYSVSFMYKYLLNLIKRKLKVQEENISCQRALNFHQWKTFSKNYKAIRVWLWPVYKFTGSILESKGRHAIFQKKDKIFENLGKNVQNLKIFRKRAASCMQLSHAWNS